MKSIDVGTRGIDNTFRMMVFGPPVVVAITVVALGLLFILVRACTPCETSYYPAGYMFPVSCDADQVMERAEDGSIMCRCPTETP